MASVIDTHLQEQLLIRRQKVETAVKESVGTENLVNLLHDVDTALEKMDKGKD